MTADTLDFGACLSRCVLMGPLREHPFELKGYLLRTNIIPHFVLTLEVSARSGVVARTGTLLRVTKRRHVYHVILCPTSSAVPVLLPP